MYKLILKIFKSTDDLTVIDAQQLLYSRSSFLATPRLGAKLQLGLTVMWVWEA